MVRAILCTSCIAFASALTIVQASAQTPEQFYAGKTVDLVIGYPPGGPTDFVGRLLVERLKDLLGQSVIIENKAGA